MASSSSLLLSLLLLATIATQTLATTAPAPAPAGKVSLTGILDKAGQYSTFIKLLGSTRVGDQVDNQVNSSSEGMTVFAPTDNAFQNLKPGTLNSLSPEDQVRLVLNHVLPKFYTLDNFQTVSNPVRTQATGSDGQQFGLNIISMGSNQVNVSCGSINTPVNNALRDQFPLAVYQVDKVLLPDLTHKVKAKAPSSSPVSSSPAKAKGSDSKAAGPVADDQKSGGFGVRSLGIGFVFGVGLATFGLLS